MVHIYKCLGGGGVLFEYSGIYSIHNIRQPSSIYMRPGDGSHFSYTLQAEEIHIVMEVEFNILFLPFTITSPLSWSFFSMWCRPNRYIKNEAALLTGGENHCSLFRLN